MEVLAPFAIAAAVGMAATKIPVTKNSKITQPPSEQLPNGIHLDGINPGKIVIEENEEFDPIKARLSVNQIEGRVDNLPVLKTAFKDAKYELTEETGKDLQYDQMNRGGSMLENQLFYSNLTKESETPLAMGFMPEYKRSSGLSYREPSTPDMLKPKKREQLQSDVFVAQPESDRRHYKPILDKQAGQAKFQSKFADGTGAMNGFLMDKNGSADGMVQTKRFNGFHPQQRFFRKDDNIKQKNPHGLRALNAEKGEIRGALEGFTSNGKRDEIARYHRIAVGSGGRSEPHLPHELRKVELRKTQR